eukprot:c24860_g2_i1 orf=279-527(-)
MSTPKAASLLNNLAHVAVAVGVTNNLLSTSLYIVDGGEQAVLFYHFRGVLDKNFVEGTHLHIPVLQKLEAMVSVHETPPLVA